MKKLIMGLCLLLVASLSHAQGLDGLVVEKYYVSNAADSAASNGNLPVGSVTYRFYADMHSAGYKLLNVFGNADHSIKFTTTTSFYNDNVNGQTTPDNNDTTKLKQRALLLDSWVSFGRAGKTVSGVTENDDNGATNRVNQNAQGILRNNDGLAGLPLTTQDGLLDVSTPATGFIGISTELDPLGDGSTPGNSVDIAGGAWFVLGGVNGPTPSNKVVIAQITTDGTLHYEFNIIVGDSTGGSVTYANHNAQAGETSFPTLAGTIVPDAHPTVSVTSPVNNSTFIVGTTIADSAVAGDTDGSVVSVQFFLNDTTLVGSGTFAGGKWSINMTPGLGTYLLTAVATDDQGATTKSAPITIHVVPAFQPYGLTTTSNSCQGSTICQMVKAQQAVSNIIGFDAVFHYDPAKVTPTGNIYIQPDLVNPSYTDYVASINVAQSKILISVFFNGSAPPSARFSGTGNVFCVEFNKTAAFLGADSSLFTADAIQESYISGVIHKNVDPGYYKTHRDSAFTGSLKFWLDNSPLKGGNNALYLPTAIQGSVTCGTVAGPTVNPDANGNFNYNIGNGLNINITRDIASATDVQPVINGFDAFLTRRMLTNDATFIPSVFQAIAMDVNEDGVISAGDLSQINERAVLSISEFKQAWNYDNSGVKIPLTGNSNDWSFFDVFTVSTNLNYSRSTSFPGDDGVGFSKARVPVQTNNCLAVPNAGPLACQFANSTSYNGVLLGDINGNFATVGSNGMFRKSASDEVVFDLSGAVISGGYVDVPVSVYSADAVNALDFSMQFNESKLTYVSVNDKVNYIQDLANYSSVDRTLRYTSNSLRNYELAKTLLTVHFAINGNTIEAGDLSSVKGYINGNLVPAVVNTVPTGLADLNAAIFVSIFPNPANDMLTVSTSQNAKVQLFDMSGKEVIAPIAVNANEKQVINTSGLAAGVYTMKVSNDNLVSVKQVVINK